MDFLENGINIFAPSNGSISSITNDNNKSNDDDFTQGEPNIWIFGYGSLCWNPGMEYTKCVTGYIRGYVRRFWQGNVTHRGTKDKPGRVATLINDDHGITWGCAYKVIGEQAVEYLKHRECTLGGYISQITKFYPRIGYGDNNDISGETFPVLLYIATPNNDYWLGDDSLLKMAKQIVKCRGASGHNVEYVIKLAIYMRNEIPEALDEHLFKLEDLVNKILQKKKIDLNSLMGERIPTTINRDSHQNNVLRPKSFEFASRVPEKRLRCLNI